MGVKTSHTYRLLIRILALALVAACSHEVIPNTDVEDTPENREVIEFIEQYRDAVAARDVKRLLSLASKEYFDDMGTPRGEDDIDFTALGKRLEATFGEGVKDVHYDIRYREVIFLPTKVLVDFTYIGRFQVETADGKRWERRLSDNRMVLARQGDKLSILSGM